MQTLNSLADLAALVPETMAGRSAVVVTGLGRDVHELRDVLAAEGVEVQSVDDEFVVPVRAFTGPSPLTADDIDALSFSVIETFSA